MYNYIPKMSSNNQEYEVSIEAGIGVGKSTILDIFSKKYGELWKQYSKKVRYYMIPKIF